jgi:exodeoxyribonuclease III
MAVKAAGYHAAVYGQRTYNGVAILSKTEPAHVEMGWPDDEQARLISATIENVRVYCAYFPNGGAVGSAKYVYKLAWMKRLREHLAQKHTPEESIALCGDFNVGPGALDVAQGQGWEAGVLANPEVRAALEEIRAWGFVDTFRTLYPEASQFSWWDYRMLSFPKNNGLRIDHVFATKPLADRCVEVVIDREERKKKQWDPTGKSSASDHVPVVARFEP